MDPATARRRSGVCRIRSPLGGSLALVVAALGACESSPTPAPTDVEPPVCPAPITDVRIGGSGGSGGDTITTPRARLVLMGGGGEDDDAARGFAEAAQGGDITILRASGSVASYPLYFTATLTPEPAPRSVLTVLTPTPSNADDPAVLCRVANSEAMWLAGGDQWDYLGGWPAPLHAAMAERLSRGAVVGGTSAGAMVLGEAAFDAAQGSVSSGEALADPLTSKVSVSYPVIAHPALARTLVDSHFSERGREGRLLAFLARFLVERGYASVVGVGLDEGVALAIEDGAFQVYAPSTGAAWLYRVTAPAQLDAGAPLELPQVERIRLSDGATGGWPFDFDSGEPAELQVTGGVVGVR